jgi:hypothetical protein
LKKNSLFSSQQQLPEKNLKSKKLFIYLFIFYFLFFLRLCGGGDSRGGREKGRGGRERGG